MPFEVHDTWKSSARSPSILYQTFRDPNSDRFRDHFARSDRSISSNVAEGCKREKPAEIASSLTIAQGSAGELITQVYIGIESENIVQADDQTCREDKGRISDDGGDDPISAKTASSFKCLASRLKCLPL